MTIGSIGHTLYVCPCLIMQYPPEDNSTMTCDQHQDRLWSHDRSRCITHTVAEGSKECRIGRPRAIRSIQFEVYDGMDASKAPTQIKFGWSPDLDQSGFAFDFDWLTSIGTFRAHHHSRKPGLSHPHLWFGSKMW